MRLAVIPARGGSKRIPRKNIRNFCGKPMLAWSIEAALASGCFDRVVVSTEDMEIAEMARQHGADVPFLRPTSLADDYTGTNAVVAHAMEFFEARGEVMDFVACIYATAPFLRPETIREGLEVLMKNAQAQYAATVTAFDFPIQRSLRIVAAELIMREPEFVQSRSQDLEPFFHDAGQLYWARKDAFRVCKSPFLGRVVPIVLPPEYVQDIDTPEDWVCAEAKFRYLSEARKWFI